MLVRYLRVVATVTLFSLSSCTVKATLFNDNDTDFPSLLIPPESSTSTLISNEFLVVLDQDVFDVAGKINDLVDAVDAIHPGNKPEPLGEPWNINNEFKGQAVRMTITQAQDMSFMVGVKYIQQDQYHMIENPIVEEFNFVEESATSWGLDRIDQRDIPLDNVYKYDYTGKGVTAYVIDTGIDKNHKELQGRILHREDFTEDVAVEDCPLDEDGDQLGYHGTHVAGTIGGKSFGVSKEVYLVDVRVFACDDTTSGSSILDGYNWIAQDAKSRGGPVVANASFGGIYDRNPAERDALAALRNSGVLLVVAAGNDGRDACGFQPASYNTTFTVASIAKGDFLYVDVDDNITDPNDYIGTNWGLCVDIFAPGVDIISAKLGTSTGSWALTGTSMATPHVAGAAALILEQHGNWTPQQVIDELIRHSTKGAVKAYTPTEAFRLSETPNNRLLFVPTNTDKPTPTNTDKPTPTNTDKPTPVRTNKPTPVVRTNKPTPVRTNKPTPERTNKPTPSAKNPKPNAKSAKHGKRK